MYLFVRVVSFLTFLAVADRSLTVALAFLCLRMPSCGGRLIVVLIVVLLHRRREDSGHGDGCYGCRGMHYCRIMDVVDVVARRRCEPMLSTAVVSYTAQHVFTIFNVYEIATVVVEPAYGHSVPYTSTAQHVFTILDVFQVAIVVVEPAYGHPLLFSLTDNLIVSPLAVPYRMFSLVYACALLVSVCLFPCWSGDNRGCGFDLSSSFHAHPHTGANLG